MARKRVRCANKKCREFLTEAQVKAGGKYHSQECSRLDGHHHQWNHDPVLVEVVKRRNEEW